VLTVEDIVNIALEHKDDFRADINEFELRPNGVMFGIKPRLMGVINLSKDSWYRESVCSTAKTAIKRGEILSAQGAALVDIGAESTLPKSVLANAKTQLDLVLPVLKGLVKSKISVSVETYNPQVAKECLQAGAAIINLTGGKYASTIYDEIAKQDAGLILCYLQGVNVRDVSNFNTEDDPIPMLEDYFGKEIENAQSAGVSKIFIDPGLGFYYKNLIDGEKRVRHQIKVFLNTFRLRRLGWPVCHALPHAFDYFGEEIRSAESLFAVLAALSKTSLFRTHEVPKVKAVLDTLNTY
tara:strand:+ start:570 stop:1457 length:888 start_codon:yes stop_codon:yes gene_type:complete